MSRRRKSAGGLQTLSLLPVACFTCAPTSTMRSFGILLLGLVVLGCVFATQPEDPVDRRRGPWFCHKKDCPAFKTVC
jgi:hypothetical protein